MVKRKTLRKHVDFKRSSHWENSFLNDKTLGSEAVISQKSKISGLQKSVGERWHDDEHNAVPQGTAQWEVIQFGLFYLGVYQHQLKGSNVRKKFDDPR